MQHADRLAVHRSMACCCIHLLMQAAALQLIEQISCYTCLDSLPLPPKDADTLQGSRRPHRGPPTFQECLVHALAAIRSHDGAACSRRSTMPQAAPRSLRKSR